MRTDPVGLQAGLTLRLLGRSCRGLFITLLPAGEVILCVSNQRRRTVDQGVEIPSEHFVYGGAGHVSRERLESSDHIVDSVSIFDFAFCCHRIWPDPLLHMLACQYERKQAVARPARSRHGGKLRFR